MILITQVLTSCFTYQRITKRGEPLIEIKSKIQVNKMHWITLKSGTTLKVFVTNIDNEKVFGELLEKDATGFLVKYPFEETFENLERNTSKIEVKKFNPYLTIALIAPLIFSIIYTTSYVY